jgi:hypothetical protein
MKTVAGYFEAVWTYSRKERKAKRGLTRLKGWLLWKKMEARAGIEPAHKGSADLFQDSKSPVFMRVSCNSLILSTFGPTPLPAQYLLTDWSTANRGAAKNGSKLLNGDI